MVGHPRLTGKVVSKWEFRIQSNLPSTRGQAPPTQHLSQASFSRLRVAQGQ